MKNWMMTWGTPILGNPHIGMRYVCACVFHDRFSYEFLKPHGNQRWSSFGRSIGSKKKKNSGLLGTPRSKIVGNHGRLIYNWRFFSLGKSSTIFGFLTLKVWMLGFGMILKSHKIIKIYVDD